MVRRVKIGRLCGGEASLHGLVRTVVMVRRDLPERGPVEA